MGDTPPNGNDILHTIATLITTVCGVGAIVALAWHGDIHDGETISGLAAVLGIQIGSYAFKKRLEPPKD